MRRKFIVNGRKISSGLLFEKKKKLASRQNVLGNIIFVADNLLITCISYVHNHLIIFSRLHKLTIVSETDEI